MPTWIKSSAPPDVFKPIACPVGNSVVTSASAGAITFPIVGSTAMPCPIIPLANTGSGTSGSLTRLPVNGLLNVSFFNATSSSTGAGAGA